MKRTDLFQEKISDVASTSLLTLYTHAMESQSEDPILKDPKAEELIEKLNPELLKSENKLYRRLAQGKLDKFLISFVALRAKRYDEYAISFFKQNPNGIVVNLGCGLDTRFYRIDDGKIVFYELDFPELITVKKKFFSETDRYHFIASSLLDFKWMESLSTQKERPLLFLAEGVFMYLQQEDVKTLVLELQANFPGSELVCEVVHKRWLNKFLKPMLDFKLRWSLKLGKEASFYFGLNNSKEMESWNHGIQFLDDWTYFDSLARKLRWFRFCRHFSWLRKTMWTIHYKLN